MRVTKTCPRTTMSQERLNHCMILHFQKEITDKLKIEDIGNQFVSASNDRKIAMENLISIRTSQTMPCIERY